MPTIKRYQRQVDNRQIRTQSGARPDVARAYNFGGDEAGFKKSIGNSVQNLGSAVNNYMVRSQDRVDRTIARDKMNEAQREAEEYMSSLYNSSDSRYTSDAYNVAQSKLEEIREKKLKQLESMSQRDYFSATYDNYMAGTLGKTIKFQESKRIELNEKSKLNQNAVMIDAVRKNPEDDSIWQDAMNKILYNSADSAMAIEDGRRDIQSVVDRDKKVEEAAKKFDLKDYLDVKEVKQSYYSDKKVEHYRKLTKEEKKAFGSLEISKLTPKQLQILTEDYDEFDRFFDKQIKPRLEAAMETFQESAREIASAFNEPEAPRPKTKPVIPRFTLEGKKHVAGQVSALMSAKIEGIMMNEKNPHSYSDALLFLNENADGILERDRKRLVNRIQVGLKREEISNKSLNIINQIQDKSFQEGIDYIDEMLTNPEYNKFAKKMWKDTFHLRELAKKKRTDDLFQAEVTKLNRDPNYKVPKSLIGTDVGAKLTARIEVAKQQRLEDAGLASPKQSVVSVFAELNDMSLRDLNAVDLDDPKYASKLNASDRKYFEKRKQLPSLKSNMVRQAVNQSLEGMAEFNPKHRSNAKSKRRYDNALKSRNELVKEIYDMVLDTKPEELNPKKIQEFIDYQLEKVSKPYNPFTRKRRFELGNKNLSKEERIEYYANRIPDSVRKYLGSQEIRVKVLADGRVVYTTDFRDGQTETWVDAETLRVYQKREAGAFLGGGNSEN